MGKVIDILWNVGSKIFTKARDTASTTAGTAIGNKIGETISKPVSDTIGKVSGIPTPETPSQPTGAELGVERRNYMDEAFPGTTPWERLGSTGSPGQVISSGMQNKTNLQINKRNNDVQKLLTRFTLDNAQNMQQNDLNLKSQINEKQNKKDLILGSINQGSKAVDFALNKYLGDTDIPFTSQLQIEEKKINALIKRQDYENRKDLYAMYKDLKLAMESHSKTKLNMIESKWANAKALKELSNADWKTFFTSVKNLTRHTMEAVGINPDKIKETLRRQLSTSVGYKNHGTIDPIINLLRLVIKIKEQQGKNMLNPHYKQKEKFGQIEQNYRRNFGISPLRNQFGD